MQAEAENNKGQEVEKSPKDPEWRVLFYAPLRNSIQTQKSTKLGGNLYVPHLAKYILFVKIALLSAQLRSVHLYSGFISLLREGSASIKILGAFDPGVSPSFPFSTFLHVPSGFQASIL